MLFERCNNCHHFVEIDEDGKRLFHLDDGEQEYDHDPFPDGLRADLAWWMLEHPYLFIKYSDGKYGPNSGCFPRVGKRN